MFFMKQVNFYILLVPDFYIIINIQHLLLKNIRLLLLIYFVITL